MPHFQRYEIRFFFKFPLQPPCKRGSREDSPEASLKHSQQVYLKFLLGGSENPVSVSSNTKEVSHLLRFPLCATSPPKTVHENLLQKVLLSTRAFLAAAREVF